MENQNSDGGAASPLQKLVMFSDGYYGKAILPRKIFEKLNKDHFINGCTDSVKYMCANKTETEHLISIGITIGNDMCCDWYKLA